VEAALIHPYRQNDGRTDGQTEGNIGRRMAVAKVIGVLRLGESA